MIYLHVYKYTYIYIGNNSFNADLYKECEDVRQNSIEDTTPQITEHLNSDEQTPGDSFHHLQTVNETVSV